jgi:uncharacterized membrane protein
MNKILLAILLSISPIAELRGGIPYILAVSAKTISNFIILPLICILANILIILPIFLFLDFLHARFLNFKFYRKTSNFFIKRIQKKANNLEPQINRYGYIALALFVAVPLPMTGAWTGALMAWLLGLNRKKSFAAISCGVLIAGVMVTLITLGGIGIFRLAFS